MFNYTVTPLKIKFFIVGRPTKSAAASPLLRRQTEKRRIPGLNNQFETPLPEDRFCSAKNKNPLPLGREAGKITA